MLLVVVVRMGDGRDDCENYSEVERGGERRVESDLAWVKGFNQSSGM